MHDAQITPAPTDDEAAAVVAAIAAYVGAEVQPHAATHETMSGWQHSAKLQVQGLQPMRSVRPPRWNTIERLRHMDNFGF